MRIACGFSLAGAKPQHHLSAGAGASEENIQAPNLGKTMLVSLIEDAAMCCACEAYPFPLQSLADITTTNR